MANHKKLERIHSFIDSLSKLPELKAHLGSSDYKALYQLLLSESDIVPVQATEPEQPIS